MQREHSTHYNDGVSSQTQANQPRHKAHRQSSLAHVQHSTMTASQGLPLIESFHLRGSSRTRGGSLKHRNNARRVTKRAAWKPRATLELNSMHQGPFICLYVECRKARDGFAPLQKSQNRGQLKDPERHCHLLAASPPHPPDPPGSIEAAAIVGRSVSQ